MKLEELVPPLELCKLIPEGEFADSAFYWFADLMQINETPPHEYKCTVQEADYKGYNWGGFRCCPAPTLQEIMAAMPYCRVYKKTTGFYVAVKEQERKPSFSGATAALKLWLKLKGIEYGK